MVLFLYAEFVYGLLFVLLVGLEHYRREIWTVGRVGEMLSLEADGRAARECGSVLTFVAVGPVVCVDLYTGFGGIDIHRAATVWLYDARGKRKFTLFALVQHEAMVVSGTILDLLVVGINVAANGLGGTEVERCALYFENLARGDRSLVDGQIEVSIDFADEVVDGRRGVGDAGQREESVRREVDDGLFVGGCHVFDNQLILIGKRVNNCDFYFTRKTFFAIGARVFKYKRLVVHLTGIPHAGVPAALAAMQAVGTVVDGQLVFLAVELELTFGNAVAVAADERREVGFGRVDDILNIVVSLNDIGQSALAVGYHNGNDGASVIGYGDFVANTVL